MSEERRAKTEAAVSLLIAEARQPGTSYRTIQFMGEPVDRIEIIHAGSGILLGVVLLAEDGSMEIECP